MPGECSVKCDAGEVGHVLPAAHHHGGQTLPVHQAMQTFDVGDNRLSIGSSSSVHIELLRCSVAATSTLRLSADNSTPYNARAASTPTSPSRTSRSTNSGSRWAGFPQPPPAGESILISTGPSRPAPNCGGIHAVPSAWMNSPEPAAPVPPP